jgi:hypothetical protein
MSFTHRKPLPIQVTSASPKHTSPPIRTTSNKLQVTTSKILFSNGNPSPNSKATTNTAKSNMTSSSQQKQQLQPLVMGRNDYLILPTIIRLIICTTSYIQIIEISRIISRLFFSNQLI